MALSPEIFSSNITLVITDTLGGIIKLLPIYVLVIWGVKTISKQMPNWIHSVFMEMQKSKTLDKAIQRRIE